MKKILILAIMTLLAASAATAQLQAGEKTFGPKLGYVSHNESVVAGLVFQYTFNPHLRISPEVGCAFRHHHEDAFIFDLNLHAPFSFVDSQRVAFYPLAGLAFNSWAWHGKINTDHINRFGANVGAGFDLRCSETLRLNIEGKYTLIKSFSAFYVTAGISYIF